MAEVAGNHQRLSLGTRGAGTGRWLCSHFALRAFANLERPGLDLGVGGDTCKDRSQDQRRLTEGFFSVVSWRWGAGASTAPSDFVEATESALSAAK